MNRSIPTAPRRPRHRPGCPWQPCETPVASLRQADGIDPVRLGPTQNTTWPKTHPRAEVPRRIRIDFSRATNGRQRIPPTSNDSSSDSPRRLSHDSTSSARRGIPRKRCTPAHGVSSRTRTNRKDGSIRIGPKKAVSAGLTMGWWPIAAACIIPAHTPHRGVAQPGRASGLGPEGRTFKSCRPDFRHFAENIVISRSERSCKRYQPDG